MIISLKVPTIGESINEVTLSRWLVKDGDIVALDQSLCEFESDKATLEFPSEKSGKIKIIAQEGADLKIGDEIATLDTDFAVAAAVKTEAPVKEESPVAPQEVKKELHVTPLAEKIAEENKVDVSKVPGTGTGGRITKDDVLRFIKEGASPKEIIAARKQNSRNQTQEKVSKLRKTIAKRLVAVKNETAMLTTFNEVDMSAVMAVREKYKAAFEKKYGVGLGFMSFFVRACCNALQEFPAVNAYFNEEQVTFNDFCDISIAVSTPKGLVVPVLRNAESMSMAEVELKIKELATKGREGTLALEEMQGGSFTITNGGVFGSLMSTPIINAPQSAILGMHKIQERPIAFNGQVVIRPMMYLALSYDHRIIDGKESVSFLVRVKEQLEKPEQLLFGMDPVGLLLEM
ncbi:MAG TPA: 2-oxoglutarate dehydrogenase complex dihydrolipoyllysine-residue succinyltransferase [Chitinophagales bacterium]|nr:2-oxoglutarate dehydrogenase complex dihydrolipoyllysine-residue succinyltransferase [Chitinophagales bacterium]HMZ90455.1 2-oxoglutarate dehydrogenase complex dihydrolipoyllysine-residue succinyltransferase [Chitinophagales bacterium]HNA58448.1 2-oxoglutarate dehydrogenase complex dihydrolipoyllysine-residue succinyltransferase [Chitinophagales bacterium]HNF70590.1 2-oxoglutarate dehydrogenase complex dihydrolipoyllysine-residue succinyltransferase [Chitinophagales bacterium]HNM31005.1 2-ox